jgi:hypothetical protein
MDVKVRVVADVVEGIDLVPGEALKVDVYSVAGMPFPLTNTENIDDASTIEGIQCHLHQVLGKVSIVLQVLV